LTELVYVSDIFNKIRGEHNEDLPERDGDFEYRIRGALEEHDGWCATRGCKIMSKTKPRRRRRQSGDRLEDGTFSVGRDKRPQDTVGLENEFCMACRKFRPFAAYA
jgi:hypothetical protein